MRRAVFILFFLSGASGLLYEVVWVRILSHIFGSTVFAVSTVLAAFMGGLALGSYLFGRFVDRKTRLLTLYGIVEIGVGATALGLTILMHHLDPLYVWMFRHTSGPSVAFNVSQVAVLTVILIIPTTLMGGTLPILGRFVARARETVGWNIGGLYALNTLGAMAGCFVAGFVMIEALGERNSILAAGALNFAIGIVAIGMSRTAGAPEPQPPRERIAAASPSHVEPTRTETHARGVIIGAFVALAISGFASLAYETFWFRALTHMLGNSTYAFSTMLTSFLFGLGVGAVIGGRWADRSNCVARDLGLVQVAIALTAALTVPLLWWVFQMPWTVRALTRMQGQWTLSLGFKFLLSFAVMAVPTLLMGMAFPLATKICVEELRKLGRSVGNLYAIDTVGAIGGSYVAGFLLLPFLGLQRGILAVALFNLTAALAAILPIRGQRLTRSYVTVAASALILIACFRVFPTTNPMRSHQQHPGDQVLYHNEDATASVKVFVKPDGTKHMAVNGFTIGGTDPDVDEKQKILAHLPLLVLDEPKSVLAIGMGTGITIGSMALHSSLEHIECVEIVPSVVEGAGYFLQENRRVMDDPRVHIIVGDGINYLTTAETHYDVISSDAKLNAEYSGNALVFAEEYYRACRDHLTPGGIFCQWIPLFLPRDEFRMVIRTFATIFPYATAWWYSPSSVVVMGSVEPIRIDPAAVASKLDNAAVRADLEPFGLAGAGNLLSPFLGPRESLLALAGPGDLNSYDRPYLEFALPRQLMRTNLSFNQPENLALMSAFIGRRGSEIFVDTGDPEFFSYIASTRFLVGGFLRALRSGLLAYGRKDFERGLVVNPSDERLLKLLQRADQEEITYLRRRRAEGANPRVDSALGNLAALKGDHGTAERYFQSAIAAAPRDASLRYNLAMTLRSQERLAEAVRELNTALDIDPGHLSIRRLLSEILAQMGNTEAAATQLRLIHKQIPDDPEPLLELAVVLAIGRNRTEAEQVLQSAIALKPESPYVRVRSGSYYLAQRDPDQARLEFERALKSDSMYSDARVGLALIHALFKRDENARVDLEKALEADPSNPIAACNLACLYAREGQADHAQEFLRRAVQLGLNDADPDLIDPYVETLAKDSAFRAILDGTAH